MRKKELREAKPLGDLTLYTKWTGETGEDDPVVKLIDFEWLERNPFATSARTRR
jgi:hypothetical protein